MFRILVILHLLALAGPAAAEEIPVAVFPFELVDTSLDGEMLGENPAETARLEKLAPRLRQAYEEAPGYRVVELGKLEEQAKAQNLQACGKCDLRLAREAGARLAVTGTVQKVSNLILNVNVYVRDAETGEMVSGGSADIRSNTDESWLRGLDWLVKNRLLKAG